MKLRQLFENLSKITTDKVVLIPVAGTKGKGQGVGGEKWRVEVNGVRAGKAFINVIDEPPLGRHASLQVFLNIKNQGKGIGRIVYAKACQQSQHNTIYAHMRKSNIASRRSAEAAGFVDVTPPNVTQLILKWKRSGS